VDATAQLLWGEIFEIFFARAFWQIWQWPSHTPRLRAKIYDFSFLIRQGVDVAVSRRRGARASSLDAERRATLARRSRAAKRVDLKSSRRATRSARERGGTARRTRAKTSIAHRAFAERGSRHRACFRLATRDGRCARGVARAKSLI